MYFEEALKIELENITELNNKVYPLAATEGVITPYLVYVSSEGVQEKYLEGYAGSKEVDCELHILSDSYPGLKDITRQVIAKVVTFQGRVIGGDNGVWIQDVTYERVTEQYIDQLFQYLCVISIRVRL
jgi:hypothetical protein